MKKVILTILSALCVLFSICFIACDKNDNNPPKTYSYFGVVQTLEGFEGLYVNVPDFGVCQLPTYKEGKNPNLALKEGDLISIDFGSEIQCDSRRSGRSRGDERGHAAPYLHEGTGR